MGASSREKNSVNFLPVELVSVVVQRASYFSCPSFENRPHQKGDLRQVDRFIYLFFFRMPGGDSHSLLYPLSLFMEENKVSFEGNSFCNGPGEVRSSRCHLPAELENFILKKVETHLLRSKVDQSDGFLDFESIIGEKRIPEGKGTHVQMNWLKPGPVDDRERPVNEDSWAGHGQQVQFFGTILDEFPKNVILNPGCFDREWEMFFYFPRQCLDQFLFGNGGHGHPSNMDSRTGNRKPNFLRINTNFLDQIFEKDGNRTDILFVNALGNLLHPEAGQKNPLGGLFQPHQFDGMRTNV